MASKREKEEDDLEDKMPSVPVAPYTEGAFERFLTSAIATIITLIFSWQIIIDMEHRASNRNRLPEGKGQKDRPSTDEYDNEKRARNGDVTRNEVSKEDKKSNNFDENVFKNTQDENKPITNRDTSNLSENDANAFGDRSLSDGEIEFLKSVDRNNDFSFDEEISMIPARVPLIQVTPPSYMSAAAKRPLEPYQTYFGSDSDSDVEGDPMYDSSKLSPFDDFVMGDYEDSSPSGSDSEVFCRHVLEAISEEDEEDYESSGSDYDSDDEDAESSAHDVTSKNSQISHNRPSNLPGRYLPIQKTQTGKLNSHSPTQQAFLNNLDMRHDKYQLNAPRAETEEDDLDDHSILLNECIPSEKQSRTHSFIADFSENIHRNSPTLDACVENSSSNNLHLGCHSDISYIDADSEIAMSLHPCQVGSNRSRERPAQFEEDLSGDNVSDFNESTTGRPSPLTNSQTGLIGTETSNGTPGGSSDNANISINSNRVGCTGSTAQTLHSPVHVDRLLACVDSQGLNTIQPSPSSKDHTGIISRNYYLDTKKPSMNRIRGQGLGESDDLNSPPFARGQYPSDVYKDCSLSNGTHDSPRGFTFVRCTDYEEDYKVTSTLLFQPRDPGVRLNVCSVPSAIEEKHTPRVIEVDVHDIGAILSDTRKAKAELLGDTDLVSENVWDDLGKFEEVTPEKDYGVQSRAPLKFEIYTKHPELSVDSNSQQPVDSSEPVILEFKGALHQTPSDNDGESDNESSSTTTGDTAIEVIDTKLHVVRIGSVDSNGTDEDYIAEILDENTCNMDEETSLSRVKKPEKEVNEEEPVFIDLAEKVHSPRFKTRRKFAPREDSGQSKVGHNSARIRPRPAYQNDNSNTEIKNAYNKGKYTPGSGKQIVGVIDHEDDHTTTTSSADESGSNSDSSGSFDCGGDSEKSPRGLDKPVPKLKLEALGEIEEELSSDSSGADSIKLSKCPRKSDTSSTSSNSNSSTDSDSGSDYEDAQESSLDQGGSTLVENRPRPTCNIPNRSGSEDNMSGTLETQYSGDVIGLEGTSRPQYIQDRIPHSELKDTEPCFGVEFTAGLPSGVDQTDSTHNLSGPDVSTLNFESYANPGHLRLQKEEAGETLNIRPSLAEENAAEKLSSDEHPAEDDDMYSRRRSSGADYSAGSADLIAYGRRPSHGKSSYVSPLASYTPPAEPKTEPKVPELTDTGVQTLRSYRQPSACTFSPERYFRPSDVDSVTFTTMVEHHGSNSVEEHEYSEKGIQITFDPLWDREDSQLVPSQDELSDECNRSSDNIDSGAFYKLPGNQAAHKPSNKPVAGKHKSSPSSSSDEDDGDFKTFEKEMDITAEQTTQNFTAKENFKPNFKAPISLEEDFDYEVAPEKKLSPREVKLSPRAEMNVSPRDRETKLPSPRGQQLQRPKTPPMSASLKQNTPSMSVDIDIDAEEPIFKAEVQGVEMAPPSIESFTAGDADDEGGSDSEAEDMPGHTLYDKFSKPRHDDEGSKVKPEKPTKPEASQRSPEISLKQPAKSLEKPKVGPKKPNVPAPKPPTFVKPDVKLRPKSEADKDNEKKQYKSILQKPVDVEPKNISHLIHLPDKITKVDRSEIKEARKEYMKKSSEPEKTNEEERKALLSKLLGTRDWSDRPKPILKKPSQSFREIDDSKREALSRELSKSKENNVGVYNKDDVKDRISAAVARQKLEDKSKFQRTPLRATVGPIACSKYNEEMLRRREMSKSLTLPAGFSFGAPQMEKEASKSSDDILGTGGRSNTLPRTFSGVLVRSPSMTLHKTASSFFSDRKSYTNLLETDIDTGEVSEKPLVMETDLDEVLRIRQVNMPPKSRSLQDLYSQAGLKPVVKDIYDDTGTKVPKKWEKTQSLIALTALPLSAYKDEDPDDVFEDGEEKPDSTPGKTWQRTTSDHEIRIAKSLTKLDLPDWYLKCPPKPAEEKQRKPSNVPQFHIGDSEVANRSRTSSMNSSFSHARPVVISTRVTMPRASPTTPDDQAEYELPSRKIKKKLEGSSAYKPIRSRMEPLDVILSKSREALVEKELKVAKRKRVTAQFQLQRWEAPVIKSPVIKRVSPEIKVKVEPETGETDPEKQEAINALADMLVAEEAPTTKSAPPADPSFRSSYSMGWNSVKPPPIPKTHNTSSESELSFVNSKQQNLLDNSDHHFKPVSSNSDPDNSLSCINPPNFDRALARSSPDLTRESPEPIRKVQMQTSQAAPELPKPYLNLSAPPDEIESISDIENALKPEPEVVQYSAPSYHSAAPIRSFDTNAVYRPVQMKLEVQPMQEPEATVKYKPPPPLRTSSRKEAERPTTLPQKQRMSAMDRLKPQRPAPQKPEVKVSPEVQTRPIMAELIADIEPIPHPQPTIKKAPGPVFTKPVKAIHFNPNKSGSPDSDLLITQDRSPSYQAPPSNSINLGQQTQANPPRVERNDSTSSNRGSRPAVAKKPDKTKSPESPKKTQPPVVSRKPEKSAERTRRPVSNPPRSPDPQETPSFRQERAPGSRTNSYRESPADYQGPARTGSYRNTPEPRAPGSRTGSYRESPADYRGPSSPRSPTESYRNTSEPRPPGSRTGSYREAPADNRGPSSPRSPTGSFRNDTEPRALGSRTGSYREAPADNRGPSSPRSPTGSYRNTPEPRAPGSRTGSYREAPADNRGPSSPRSPTGSYRNTTEPRTGSYRNAPTDIPASHTMPAEQRRPRSQVEFRQKPQTPQTPERPYTEVGHHPNWRPPPPEDLRRSYQGTKVNAPRAVSEADSDLSLYNSPEPMSPRRTPQETDLDAVGIRRLPARAVIETDIDSDLYDSPLRKKSHVKQVLETNIDDEYTPVRSSSFYDSQPVRTSSYRDKDRTPSYRNREPAPSLPPKRYTGYQAETVRDPGHVPSIPPRWDSERNYPEKQRDYGPAPNIPPRKTPTKPLPIETDIDADLSFHSDDSRGSSRQRSVDNGQKTVYNNVANQRGAPVQNDSRYYDNVPGSGGPERNQQNNNQTQQNQEPSRNRKQQQVPLYYQAQQQGPTFKAPPIPPREITKDVPPPAIHKVDGLFETDIDFNLNSFETVAVEGDAESNTPHGTLTRFGRNQKAQSSTQQHQRSELKSDQFYNFDFEPPSHSMPPTPITTSTTTFATCHTTEPCHVTSSSQSRPSHNVPMDTEEDMLYAFVVNKQPKELEEEDDVIISSKTCTPGSLEYGPESFRALGRRSDLKVDTNSFRFSKEEDKFKCEVGFSGASEQEASLAEVLDGLLALPPSPQGSSPCSDTLAQTPDSIPDNANGFFGPISESGENILSLNKRGQNIDENGIRVKCRKTNCGKEMVLAQARCSFKTCHNCYTYYCCRNCRRHDWSDHKTACSYNRITSMCKHIIKKINKNPNTLFSVSKKARSGYLASGRGCVLFVFENFAQAELFVRDGESAMRFKPVYCSMTELEEYYVLGEYGDAVMDMCVDYSPYLNFIVSVAIVMGKDTGHGKRREGPVIKRCAKLCLSASLSESESDSITSEHGALVLTVGYNKTNTHLTPHEARDESFDNVQKKLRQRGVCLREQYPDVFNKLVAYVNENQAFAPITIYPYDGSTGNTFMCVIKLDSDLTQIDSGCQITFDTFI